ncbi:MAG TPA: hypothetical protein DEO85_01395 [Maritimibacter sp.]|nr:hypothetical protein [Maritimibacter sp.]
MTTSNENIVPEIERDDLEIWKKVVDVQMHFNDLELRLRNYAIIALGAILTVAGYSLNENRVAYIGSIELPAASIFLFASIVLWGCFWYMDRHWYHRLLTGSVVHGIKIEDKYQSVTEAICLSRSIKEASPHSFAGLKFRSKHRLDAFYLVIGTMLFILAWLLINPWLAVLWLIAVIILVGVVCFVYMERA